MVKLADIILEKESSSKARSEKFARKVRDDVYPILVKQANFVIRMMKEKRKPTDPEVLDQMNYFMRHYSGENPIESVDTYGITLMLGYLIKDPNLSSKAKRYYKSLIDAWLKKRV